MGDKFASPEHEAAWRQETDTEVPRPRYPDSEPGWSEQDHPDRSCPYCRDLTAGTGESCGATAQGWACTRPPGHSGPHVACGGDVHHMADWGGRDG